ncbi:ABC transporter permease [Lysinibacillus pakistanensis]|uniref:ABC transporter permease n=1 Tax=Lysinibacillus pakistanensis TaxID=759811 RepID=UPI003D26729D
MMNDFWIMFCANFKTMFKTKSFFTVTIMIALAIAAIFNIDRLYQLIGIKEQHAPILVTASNQEVATNLQDFYSIGYVEGLNLQFVDSLEEAKKMLTDTNEYEYILTIGENEKSRISATLISETEQHIEVDAIQTFLNVYQNYMYVQKASLTADEYREMYASVNIATDFLRKEVKTGSYNTTNMIFVYAFIFIFYFSIILYTSQLANAIASEKSLRVMEIMISSISAKAYLFAKIFATLALSLTQISIWILVFTLSIKTGSYERLTLLQDIALDELNITLVYLGILFYVVGFVLYGSLSCLVGSLMTNGEEASQAIFPIVALLLAALFIGMDGVMSPNSTLLQISSYIPFFTPITMFIRIAFVEIHYVAIILSISALCATTILAVFMTALVFRGGILLYAKGSFKNLKQALKI